MDYKEKYEAVMNDIDAALLGTRDEKTKIILENIKSRNAESEDERIREELAETIRGISTDCLYAIYLSNEQKKRYFAWLEKQKKCHPDDVLNRTYQEGFEDGFKAGREVERRNSSDADFMKSRMQEPWNKEKQKEQKPILGISSSGSGAMGTTPPSFKLDVKPVEWSEEDEKRYISCLQRLGTGNSDQPETINSKWFKEHVSPHPHWKPSKELIYSLGTVVKGVGECTVGSIGYNLRELYEQLKKLM